jgi:hypothetical protein
MTNEREQRVGQVEPGFRGYPQDWMLGVFDDCDAASAAFEDLRPGYWHEGLMLFRGEQGERDLDRRAEEAHSGVAGVWQAIQSVFVGGDHLEDYERAVRDGACVLAVRTAQDEQRAQALAVFERHHARFIHFYGSTSVQQLVP